MSERAALLERLRSQVLVFDGAVGTLLMSSAGEAALPPERLNLTQPDVVEAVHRQYVAAGADIIQTNTFGANGIKLAAYGLETQAAAICHAAVASARRAAGAACLVAGCIGPTGMLLQPFGQLSAVEAYTAFRAQVVSLAEAGVDLLNIETMTDLLEAKLALLAARDAAPGLPVMVSITFDRGLRTLTGTDPATAAVVLAAAGADLVGTNCGAGPADSLAALRLMHEACDLPLIVKPNAGLPSGAAASLAHPIGPAEFAGWVPDLMAAGASLIGGCCGTTPAHLAGVKRAVGRTAPVARGAAASGCVASSTRIVPFGAGWPARIIGERINPTGRKDLQAAMRQRDWSSFVAEARRQEAAGADIIDINVGYRLPGLGEEEAMAGAVQAVQHGCSAPLAIDTRDLRAMESALLLIRGKPLLNSTTADAATLSAVLSMAARHGAAVIGLPIAAGGVPETALERLALVSEIALAARRAGLPPADLVIDGLTLTAGLPGTPALVALETVRAAKVQFGVSTVLGVSNVSHGLPGRDGINLAFLSMAQAAGLDLAIVNPLHQATLHAVRAGDLLTGRDVGARRYVGLLAATPAGQPLATPATAAPAQPDSPSSGQAAGQAPDAALISAVIAGDAHGAARAASSLLEGSMAPLAIINECVVPALERVGADYESQRAFLPQLLLAAEAAQAAFRELEPMLLTAGSDRAEGDKAPARAKVILATVRGDMHDIGKNILALLLHSHGFEVVDLGRDVAAERVVAVAALEAPAVIGLSALMTTTMPEMAKTCELLAAAGLRIPVIVGGAVLNAEYAASIGANYAPDAVSGVRRIAELAARMAAGASPS